MRKILSVCLILVILLSPATFANDVREEGYKNDISVIVNKHNAKELTIIIGNETAEGTRVVTNCPYGNGICDAKSNGRATVIVNGSIVINGSAFQCQNCYMVFATQYHPLQFNMIGNYATASYPELIGGGGIQMYVSSIGYTTLNTLPGVRFRY
jgi:hypothetical protein